MLLNDLPQEMQIIHLCGFSRLLSHSVFWDMFLMHQLFQFVDLSNQNVSLPKFSRRTKHVLVVHFEISRLLRGLGHLADRNSIPQSPTHPRL